MRVLVTGGLGVIGSWVVRELLAAGHEPIALDTGDDTTLVADILTDFECKSGNVLDVELVCGLLGGVDQIVHLAALLPAEADPYAGYQVNALGPVAIFEAARRAGVRRVVWASAKAVYGELSGAFGYPTYEPVPETHSRQTLPFAPVYSSSKLLAEEASRHYATTFDMECVALRFATIYGPGKLLRHGGTGLVGVIVEHAISGEPTRAPQGRDERDELIYVREVANGVIAACLAGSVPSPVYNIGSGHLVTIGEFADAVSGAVAPADFEIGPGRDPFGIGLMYGVLDSSRALREIGFKPTWTLEAALRDYAASISARRPGG